MSGLGNVLTGFIGGAAGGIVAIGGVQRLREKRESVRRRKETPEPASEEPAHTGSSEVRKAGARPAASGDVEARLARVEAGLAAQGLVQTRFEERFERVMGKAAKRPGAAAERDEPVVAYAAFLREIDETGFDPKAAGAGEAQRAAYRAAREAAEKAEHWLGRTGDKRREREVYAAVGEGRKALIRLDALRRGRPVPLEYADPARLSGFLDAGAAPYTEDRFRWKGRGDGEFLLDRPRPGAPVLVEVRWTRDGSNYMKILENEKTDRTVRQVGSQLDLEQKPLLYFVPAPEVTHLAVEGAARWTVTVVDTGSLPETAASLSGRGAAAYRHALGECEVTVQGTGDAQFVFYPDCDCEDVCADGSHWCGTRLGDFRKAFRQDLKLPRAHGVLVVETGPKTLWSLDLVTDQ